MAPPPQLHHNKSIVLSFVLLILQISLVTCEKTISEKMVEGLKKCGKEVGVKSNSEMTPAKVPCFTKCIMEDGGLLDAEGKAHKENILRDIEAAAPPEVKEAYKKAIEACIDSHGQNIVPDDATCSTYAALGMCTIDAIKTIRHIHI